ncbi:MAG: ABC-F family ATP-binding cassette domain-containing protein [Opitutales bacterium]|nr:ABC-F family ATP-binding cassette domain-containing protein [Opitutales bacterium]
MYNFENIKLRFGPRELFKDITGTIGARERIGLVGQNGAGKSTLLKIIAGTQDYDAGTITAAKAASIAYLPQDGIECAGTTLYGEVEKAFDDVLSLQDKIAAEEKSLQSLTAGTPDYLDKLALINEWEERLEHAEASKMRSRIESVLLGLGFKIEDMTRDTGEFSGGWQMRIALAKLLLREPSILLLDEPTNHLDVESQDWLENWLKRYAGSVVIVSHDRAFLDTICTRIFALENGRLDTYEGNYSYYEKTSRERREALRHAAENQAREIAKTEDFIERFRYKASKAAQVQSRIKQLDKVERIYFEEENNDEIEFSFPPGIQSGQKVVTLAGVAKSYGTLKVFNKVDLQIERGERIAVVGVNGAGKSTLIRMLSGEEVLSAGTRTVGNNVVISYFAQHQAKELDPTKTVLETVNDVAVGLGNTKLRSLLGAFLFRGEDVFKPVNVLSGGEKNRLALAKMLLRPFNFLILDEPTNHLDMRSKDVLCRALKEYAGTVIVVSHDRAFLDPLVNKVIEVRNGGIRVFSGNVSYYLEKTKDERVSVPAVEKRREDNGKTGTAVSAKDKRRAVAERSKALAPLKKELKSVEEKIASLEAEQAEIETAMANPDFYSRGEATKKEMLRYETLKAEIAELYERWEQISLSLEA